MSDYCYKLNCGQYVLHEGDDPIGAVMDEVSICFDKESGTLHKHGRPELVQDWHAKAQAKYREAGFDEMADELIVITGRFALEDLNRCLSTSGYVGVFYNRLLKGEAAPQPLS
ncbi:uncharacterized protein NMK_2185 [Novimethylophilus kurashikiensis]|uniref:Uncharacterized protein n=1 Tax=Novimethylophilus kurashikiensis TaxID=1825523 RepID=A0A2R5F8N5_9PROT|nr:hypothetical protein [Novimethylophilus kurashikiensis]GBG14586.1 uncharacterized protein NMK_2185 [Novimethylophilus kurashikiensis]